MEKVSRLSEAVYKEFKRRSGLDLVFSEEVIRIAFFPSIEDATIAYLRKDTLPSPESMGFSEDHAALVYMLLHFTCLHKHDN